MLYAFSGVVDVNDFLFVNKTLKYFWWFRLVTFWISRQYLIRKNNFIKIKIFYYFQIVIYLSLPATLHSFLSKFIHLSHVCEVKKVIERAWNFFFQLHHHRCIFPLFLYFMLIFCIDKPPFFPRTLIRLRILYTRFTTWSVETIKGAQQADMASYSAVA